MSSAKSRSVSAFAGCLRDLCGCSVRPSSLSLPSTVIRRAQSRTTMDKNGASVSPWSTPVVISNSSDVPSVVTTLALVLVYIDLMAISSRDGIPYAFRILNISFRWIELNAFLKSKNVITAGRLFFRTSSRMRRKADDTLLYFASSSANSIESNLSADLDNVIQWLNSSYLHLNYSKTKVMLTGTHQRLRLVTSFNVCAHDKLLERVYKFKYLGVFMAPTLSYLLCW